MRFYVVLTLVALIFLINGHSTDTEGATGGNVFTTTSLSAPQNIIDGQTITISSNTVSDLGPAFLGEVSFVQLTEIQTLGKDPNSIYSASNLSIEFTPRSDIKLFIIKIPIQSISTDQSILWSVEDNSGNTLVYGDLSRYELQEMQNNKELVLSIGTFQTDPIDWTTGLQLTAQSIYKIRFSVPNTSTFSIDLQVSSISDNVLIYDNNVLQDIYGQLILMGGSFLSKQPITTPGITSIDLTVSSGLSYILAYYGDLSASFAPSHSIITLDVQSTSSYSLSLSNVTSSPGSTAIFSTIIQDNANPVSNVLIDYYIYYMGIYDLLGSATSDATGIAQLSYLLMYDPGIYLIRAGTVNGNTISDYANLTITNPPTQWSQLQAIGEFGSVAINQSKIIVEGTLQSTSGNAASNVEIQVKQSGILQSTIFTNANGYFSIELIANLPVGYYQNYYGIAVISNYWQNSTTNLDLTITKGNLNISVSDVKSQYLDQPVIITGNIRDRSGLNVSVELILERLILGSNQWQEITRLNSNNGFSYQLISEQVGQSIYRIRIEETITYLSVVKQFNVIIDPSSLIINRELPTSIIAEYHQPIDLSVDILDTLNTPIAFVEVSIFVIDPINGLQELVTLTTNSTGRISYSWIPGDQYVNFMFLSIPIIYSTYNPNYVNQSLSIDFQIIYTDLQAEVDVINPIYDTIGVIAVTITDIYGYPALSGTSVNIIIESTLYTQQVNTSGIVEISHWYSNVGAASLSITIDQTIGSPYNAFSQQFTYTVNKAAFRISPVQSEYNTSKGERIEFVAEIFDHNDRLLSNAFNVTLSILDQSWIIIGSAYTNNLVYIQYFIPLEIGTYLLKWSINGNSLYNTTELTSIISVNNVLTNINITYPTTYDYGSPDFDRIVDILLQIPNINIPISYQSLSINFPTSDAIFSWSLTTNNAGQTSLVLPKFITPGTYNLTVKYNGLGDFLASNTSISIIINGVDVNIDWIVPPIDTYYGETMNASILVYDKFGNILPNMTVQLSYQSNDGDVLISTFTDINGIANFSFLLKSDNDTVGINILVLAKDGWNAQSISQTVNNPKKTLIGNPVNIVNYYSRGVELMILINSTNDEFLSNVYYELFWFNNTENSYRLMSTGYSNNTGWIYLNLTDILVDRLMAVGSDYRFRWDFYDVDYISTSVVQIVYVEQMPISMNIEYNTMIYNRGNLINFTILDIFGMSVDGIEVILTYTTLDQSINRWQTTSDVVNGIISFEFNPPEVGNLTLTYQIIDSNGNYVDMSGTFQVIVMKSETQLYYSWDDGNGDITLIIYPRDRSNNSILTGSLVLSYFDDQTNLWQILNTIDLNQTTLKIIMIIFPFADLMQFRVDYLENNYFLGSTQLIRLNLQDIQIEYQDQIVRVNGTLELNIQLLGNGTLDGYQLTLFILDDILIEVASYISINGSIKYQINLDQPIGNYTIILEFRPQGWYRASSQIYNLQIIRNELSIHPQQISIIHGVNNTLVVALDTENTELDLSGIMVEFYVWTTYWNLLGSGLTSSDGTALIKFYTDLPMGNYTFIISTLENNLYKNSNYQFTHIIVQETILEMELLEHFIFDVGGAISILLVDSAYNMLVNAPVSLFISYWNDQYQNYSAFIFLNTMYTNSSGMIVFDINYELLISNKIKLYAEYTMNSMYGESSSEIEVMVYRSFVTISYSVIDYGITHNTTIITFVRTMNNERINGSIIWKFTTLSGTIILDGDFELINGEGIFTISAEYIGEFIINLRYTDTNGIRKYNDQIINFNLRWDKVTTQIETSIPEIQYGEIIDIQINVMNSTTIPSHSLKGILVKIVLDAIEYTGKTNINGIVTFSINQSLIPGNYSLQIIIDDTILYSNIDKTILIIINPGNQAFSVNINDALTLPNSQYSWELADKLSSDELTEYFVTLYLDGKIIIFNRTSDETLNHAFNRSWTVIDGWLFINSSSPLLPGYYTIEILRTHPYYEDQRFIFNFEIQPIPLDLNYNYYLTDDGVLISFNATVIEYLQSINSLNPIEPQYIVSLTINGINYEYDSIDNISLEFNSTATILLIIEGYGYFDGSLEDIVEIKITEPTIVSISVSTNSTEATNILDNFQSYQFELLIGTLFISTMVINRVRKR